MDENSVLSFLSKLIDDDEQIKVLKLMSEDKHGDDLLEKLLQPNKE